MLYGHCQQHADAKWKIVQKTLPVHHVQIIEIPEQRRNRYRRDINFSSKPLWYRLIASSVKQRLIDAKGAMYEIVTDELTDRLHIRCIWLYQFIHENFLPVNLCICDVRSPVENHFDKGITDWRDTLRMQPDYDITLGDAGACNDFFPVRNPDYQSA